MWIFFLPALDSFQSLCYYYTSTSLIGSIVATSPIRNKLVPFKVLVTLLYGEHPWLSRDEVGGVFVKTGPMSRAMLVSVGRLNEYLQYLQQQGFLTITLSKIGWRYIRITTPPTMVHGKCPVCYALEMTSDLLDIQGPKQSPEGPSDDTPPWTPIKPTNGIEAP